MKGRQPQLLLLIAFVGSILASVVPIGFSLRELANQRGSLAQINDANAVALQARNAGDRITALVSDFPALLLGREVQSRTAAVSTLDAHVADFTRAVLALESATPPWLAPSQGADLARAAESIRTHWSAIRQAMETGEAATADTASHVLQLVAAVKAVQAILRMVEEHTAALADAETKRVLESLAFTASILVGGIVVGFLISSFGSLSIFHLLYSARKRNAELTAAKDALRTRTEQLTEAHRIGKMSDWHMPAGARHIYWSPEAYHLIGHTPDTFAPSFEAVRELFVEDGLQRVLDAQRDVLSTGAPKSVDIKIRRADGSIGDFTVTSKAEIGSDGRTMSFFGTVQDISERKAAEKQLEALAYYDPLTGLANRVLFSRRLDEVLQRARRTGTSCALLLLDLDRFKDVNDALGHPTGDQLLVRVARLVSDVLGARHFLARIGGDEFAIIVEEPLETADIERLAGNLIAALSGNIVLERAEVNVGTSIGIVTTDASGHDADDLLRNADLALYRAKEDGRGRCAFFTPDMNTAAQRKMALASDLRRALATGNGLSLCYQPQVELATGRVVGFEALVRWTHAARGDVSPAEFVPIAENSSLICDLGNWALRQAAEQAKAWLDSGAPRQVSVNVSAAQIWHSDLMAEVSRVLAETQLPPHLLCLELTESLMADHSEARVRSALKALKELGVTIALDDFGTDYSSLGYLAQLPIDKLKIDRVFVQGAAGSHRARELLEGIIALGRGLGMTVIAEGAETQEDLAILARAGCDHVQGHVFSPAVAAQEAQAFAEAPANPRAVA